MTRPTLTVALLLLLAAGAAYAQEEPGFDDMQFRSFDVSMLVTPQRSEFGPRLGPANRYSEVYAEEEEPVLYLEGDALADVIRDTIAPETWDLESAEVRYREGGKLIVRNLPEVVRRIEALIEDLQAGASRRVLIRADLYELPAGAGDEVLAGASPGAIAGANRIASGSTETRPGVQAVVTVTNRVRFAGDYDVEIAQGSELSDPLVAAPAEGFVLEVLPRVTLAGDRVVLQCYQQSGRFLRPFRTVTLGVDEEYFAKRFRSDRRYLNGRLELPVYEEANAFFTRVVGSGESFAVPILREGKLFALEMTARVIGRGGLAGFYDLGVLAGRWRNPWFGFPTELEPEYVAFFAPAFHDGGGFEHRLFDGVEEVMDLVTQNVQTEKWEDGDSTINCAGETRLLVSAEDDLRRAVEAFLGAREAETLTPVSLDVAVYSVPGAVPVGETPDGPPEGALLRYRARLDTLPGLRAGLQAGSRAAFLADYDVEVAQDSRIADPIVGLAFGGIAGQLNPRLSTDRKRMSVELSLLLSHRGPITQFLSGTQYLGPIEKFDTARTVLNQTIEMAAGGTYWIDAGTDPLDPKRRIAVRIGAGLN